MKNGWITEAAAGADKSRGYVILEKPDCRKYLDDMLIKRFWPEIRKYLKETGYGYSPEKEPETKFKLSYDLRRTLTFMLLNGGELFYRGTLCCSLSGYMLRSEFFLDLTEDNEPEVLFEILGNSRFRGNPPSMIISKNMPAGFFQILFDVGAGKGWGLTTEAMVCEKIKESIDVSVRLHEMALDGIILPDDLSEFLSLMYEVYEAY